MIEIDKRDLALLNRRLDNVVNVLGKDRNVMIKKIAEWALVSAVKVTEPGNGGMTAKLAKKFRIRPLKPIPATFGYYYKNKDTGNIFKSETPIRVKRNGNIKAIKKGVKYWNAKRKAFSYIPYDGNKANAAEKVFKIPYAGAGKAGWKSAYKNLVKKRVNLGDENRRQSKPFSRVIKRPGAIEITNLVSYVAKISPQAARVGLRKASNRFEGQYKKQIERRIERDWRKMGNSFVKGLRAL